MLQRGDSNMVEACFCARTEGGSYSLSHDGFLCMFDHQRALTKWVDVKVNTFFHRTFTLCFLPFDAAAQVSGASSISCSSSLIACGCNEGIVRLFETETLLYKATLPRPLSEDLAYIESCSNKHPDVKSVSMSRDGSNLCVLYADR